MATETLCDKFQPDVLFDQRPLGRSRPQSPTLPLPPSTPSKPSRQFSETRSAPSGAAGTSASHAATSSSIPQPVSTTPPPDRPAASDVPASRFSLPRITAQHWRVPSLCSTYRSFQEVRRVSALSAPATISKALDEYEQDGIPLIISDWHEHPKWRPEIFNLDWLLRTSGSKHINVRNVHDRRDQSMTLSDFVNISREQSPYSTAGETQRLYWKDADCPDEWRNWLLRSDTIPSRVLPLTPDDYLGYLSPSEAVESLLCYMGIGDTYTPAHKDLCASSGHNLMCFSENGGTSYWFMTASDDAPRVARYFHERLGQELDWETHVTTVEELGKAPFTVYIAEQKVGDLVLVPPRSCHQVVNYGGLAMKASWSRMTLDSLKTALHCELPIYRRVCRPEQYRVKTILYRSMLHLTEELQKGLAPRAEASPSPSDEIAVTLSSEDIVGELNNPGALRRIVDYPDLPRTDQDATSVPSSEMKACAEKLQRLVQLFDDVLYEEFAACHAELDHVLRFETSAGWGLAPAPSTPSGDGQGGANASSSGFRFRLQPPTGPRDDHMSDRAKERAASCNFACDFCGADIFQSFFECKHCRETEEGATPQVGDGLLVCPPCYVEGRSCECDDMQPVQCRPFDVLLSDRNQAVKVVSCALSPLATVRELEERDFKMAELCIFEAACALREHKIEGKSRERAHMKRTCRSNRSHPARNEELLNCAKCHGSKCFVHLLDQGIHSAEAMIKYRERGEGGSGWHAFHKEASQRHRGLKERLFDLDGVSCLRDRLRIAAMSFRKCRPVHPLVLPGFYDRINTGANLRVDVAAVMLAEAETAEALEERQPTPEEMSPLTSISSPSDSLFDDELDQGSENGDHRGTNTHPPLSQLSTSSTAVDGTEVIEIEYSESDSHSRPPQPTRPTTECYVLLPPPPRYAPTRKRAASPSPTRETPLLPRKKPRSARMDDPEDRVLRTRASDEGYNHPTRTQPPSRPATNSVMHDPANESAIAMAQALQKANNSEPVYTHPRPGIRTMSAGRRVIVGDSESDGTPPPPSQHDVAARTPAALLTRAAPEPAQHSPSSPVMPRSRTLKRVRSDAVPGDKSASQTVAGPPPPASSGRVVKKHKGSRPPGIPESEMARRREEEAQEKEEKTAAERRSGRTSGLSAAGKPHSTRRTMQLPRIPTAMRAQASTGLQLVGCHSAAPDTDQQPSATVYAALMAQAEEPRTQWSTTATTLSTPVVEIPLLPQTAATAPSLPGPSLPPAPAPDPPVPPPTAVAPTIASPPAHPAASALSHTGPELRAGGPLSLATLSQAAKRVSANLNILVQSFEHITSERYQEQAGLRQLYETQRTRLEEENKALKECLQAAEKKLEEVRQLVDTDRKERGFMASTIRKLEDDVEHLKAAMANPKNSAPGDLPETIRQYIYTMSREAVENLVKQSPVAPPHPDSCWGFNGGQGPPPSSNMGRFIPHPSGPSGWAGNGSYSNPLPPQGPHPAWDPAGGPSQMDGAYGQVPQYPVQGHNRDFRSGPRMDHNGPRQGHYDHRSNNYGYQGRGSYYSNGNGRDNRHGDSRSRHRSRSRDRRDSSERERERARSRPPPPPPPHRQQRRHSSDDVEISEFSESGRRQANTPPSTIESYPSPHERERERTASYSTIKDSSFAEKERRPRRYGSSSRSAGGSGSSRRSRSPSRDRSTSRRQAPSPPWYHPGRA